MEVFENIYEVLRMIMPFAYLVLFFVFLKKSAEQDIIRWNKTVLASFLFCSYLSKRPELLNIDIVKGLLGGYSAFFFTLTTMD